MEFNKDQINVFKCLKIAFFKYQEMMSRRTDSRVPNLFAPEPDASIQNHELDNDEPDEGEEEQTNEDYNTGFLSDALSDTTITIPRGGSVSGGRPRHINN